MSDWKRYHMIVPPPDRYPLRLLPLVLRREEARRAARPIRLPGRLSLLLRSLRLARGAR